MAVSITTRGIATIRWGTSNLTNGNLANAIVESFSRKPIKDRTKTPNNDGFTVRTTDINDGEEISLECVYDSNIVWPVEGDTIGFKQYANASNVDNYEVVEVEKSATRKKEGSITVKAERYYGITYT
jgi:hypothetical protein